MKLFNKIAIVGVGLIGGSIGLELKRKRLTNLVIGMSFHKNSITLAKKRGAIDIGSLDFSVLKDADLVILATPVFTMIELAPLISRVIKKDCIVTDVGSTKEKIVSNLEKIFPNYIGSHPLAGSQKRSISNAKIGLFKGTLVILTPTKKTKPAIVNKIERFWVKLGAKVTKLKPSVHDLTLAYISHLAHIAAFSLIESIPQKYLAYSASGLKDTTRIASSDSRLWADVFLSNRKNIIKSIAALELNLYRIKSAIKNNKKEQLIKLLKKSQLKREKLG